MLQTAIIVFREVLEAALVIGIVAAACRGVPRRAVWIAAGIAAGISGACLVAVFAEAIAAAASGIGQELLNAAILSVAVAMLGWHCVWMGRHGREMAQNAGRLGKSVATGELPLYAVATAIGMAVLREGSETVLFLAGIASGSEDGVMHMIAGGLLGATAGIATGALLYAGLLRIPLRSFFAVTNVMVLLLAAGMAASAAGFLVQADVLAPLANPLWDASAWLSETSILGKILHGLIGYEARPAGVQVVAYVLTLVSIWTLMRLAGRHDGVPQKGSHATKVMAARLCGVLAASAICVPHARAEFKIRYPNIDYREVEIEHNYSLTFDKRAEANHNATSPTEIGLGVLPFWFVELEGEFSKVPGEGWSFDAVTFENYFMLTEPGQYWLDFSIFAEYARAQKRNDPDSVELGLLFQKEDMNVLNTLNLYWEKPIGHNAEPIDTVKYAWQTRYRLNQYFQPGIEFYGEIEDVSHPGRFNDQQFRIGPMFAGSYNLSEVGGAGKIKYEAGYLFGATSATEDGTLRTRFEYELPF